MKVIYLATPAINYRCYTVITESRLAAVDPVDRVECGDSLFS